MSLMCLGYSALDSYARKTSAISAEAQVVTQAASSLLRSREASQSLFGRKALAISGLRSVVSEVASTAADDPDQAIPTSNALRNAEDFLRALPDDIQLPGFSVDPDGAIALDWIQSRTRMFSISISDSERVAYAWLDGSDRGHAVARFRGQHISPQLLSLIRTVAAYDLSGLRAA